MSILRDRILVIGACGQIGTELTLALRAQYGAQNVVAADIRGETDLLKGTGLFIQLDVLDLETLLVQVKRYKISQVYLLSAMLSATGEQYPHRAWQLNMQGLINVLEAAREQHMDKVFWPSSIAVFGPSAPKIDCPQDAVQEPATMYGISKMAGEQWCSYYHRRYGLDVRSLRYPGLISHATMPGGGTTDYAVDIFHKAIDHNRYTCFLEEGTVLPMMYMPDAIRATLELMETPASNIRVRSSYNVAGLSFAPEALAAEIGKTIRTFVVDYLPDYRQSIADSWPCSIDDARAQADWNWLPEYDLSKMTADMLGRLLERKYMPV